VSIGTFSGSGSGALAEVTNGADVEATVGSAASLTTSGAVVIKATGDNQALVESDAGSGGIVGVTGSTLSAKVGGGVKAALNGDGGSDWHQLSRRRCAAALDRPICRRRHRA